MKKYWRMAWIFTSFSCHNNAGFNPYSVLSKTYATLYLKTFITLIGDHFLSHVQLPTQSHKQQCHYPPPPPPDPSGSILISIVAFTIPVENIASCFPILYGWLVFNIACFLSLLFIPLYFFLPLIFSVIVSAYNMLNVWTLRNDENKDVQLLTTWFKLAWNFSPLYRENKHRYNISRTHICTCICMCSCTILLLYSMTVTASWPRVYTLLIQTFSTNGTTGAT